MNRPLDAQALGELLAHAERGEPVDRNHLEITVRAYREQHAREERMRADQAALMELARSEAIRSGDLGQALREITETAAQILNVARASVWRYDAERSSLICLDLYRQADNVHDVGIELSQDDFPSYFNALRQERVISAHDAHTDPRTAEFSQSYLTPLGIYSMLDAPLNVGGEMIGVTCNEHTGAPRTWSAFDQLCASALADFAALAFNSQRRQQTEDALRSAIEIAEERLQIIEEQRLAIADLSAPIIDLWDGILALPIIGSVNAERSMRMTEQLLNRIVRSGTRAVIVDLTGVDVVDTMTANYLLQMVRATRLLGANCVLSGMSPSIAQSLVSLHIDLTEIVTVRSLEDALKVCMRDQEASEHRSAPTSIASAARLASKHVNTAG